MASGMMCLSYLAKMRLHGSLCAFFIGKGQWKRIPVKLASFGFKEPFAWAEYFWESVPFHLAHGVEHYTEHLHGMRVSAFKKFIEGH